jgi:phosphatidylglycerol lysyltransferase
MTTASAFLTWLIERKKWLIAGAALLLAWMLFESLRGTLRELRYEDVIDAIQSIGVDQLLLALLATALSFAALTEFDQCALRYVGASVPRRLTAPTAFIAYALANSIGLGVLTGGAVRLRFYGAAGVEPAALTRAIGFNAVAFAVGIVATGALATLFTAEQAALIAHVPAVALRAGAALILAALGILLWRSARGGAFLPSFAIAVRQLLLSIVDIAASAAALWCLLPEGAVSLPAFITFYALAVALGVISTVPGGLGVFETTLLLALGNTVPADRLAGAIIVYRLVYYLVPLACALILLSVYELRRGVAAPVARAVSQVSPLLLAAFTFIVGVMLLVSGALPATDAATALLSMHVPLVLVEAAHFLGSIAGLALLFVARGMLARLDAAWWSGVIIAAISLVLALPKGIAVSEAGVLTFLLVALWASRRHFTRKASLLAGAFEPAWWLALTIIVIGVAGLVIFAYRDVGYSQEMWWQFEFDGHAPRSLRATVAVILVALAFAVTKLMRPAKRPLQVPTGSDLEQAQRIVEQQDNADAGLALMGDKALMFSDSGESFVMYGRQGRSWIALFDPIGRDADRPRLVWRLREAARNAGGHASFYQVRPNSLPIYLDAGLRLFKLGEHAYVELADFSLQGPRRATLRQGVNRAEREGLSFEVIAQDQVAARLPQLEQVSNAWLAHNRTGEKGFSLGAYDPHYISRQPVALALKDGTIVAFASLLGTARKADASVDLMRQLPDAPKSAMDYLLTRTMLHFREAGYARFGLGMAPLSGMAAHPLASSWHRWGRRLFNYGEYFYNFQGLRSFKEKFDPVWEPRYLATGGALPLMTLADIALLISGGLRAAVSK